MPVYEARRRRTVQLVEASAEALKAERTTVSLATLAARTRQLDPAGKGVSETTIQRNPEARAIYELHRAAVGTRRVERSATASTGAAKVASWLLSGNATWPAHTGATSGCQRPT